MLSALPVTDVAYSNSDVSVLMARTSMRIRCFVSITKLPISICSAPSVLPILAAVSFSTRPVAPRSCSASSACNRSRSTTRIFVLADNSVIIISASPLLRGAYSALLPIAPFVKYMTATVGRVDEVPWAPAGEIAAGMVSAVTARAMRVRRTSEAAIMRVSSDG